jgi:cation transport ATPase
VAALTLALSGQMTPLRCAVVMPLSSVLVVLTTVRALRERAPQSPAAAPPAVAAQAAEVLS